MKYRKFKTGGSPKQQKTQPDLTSMRNFAKGATDRIKGTNQDHTKKTISELADSARKSTNSNIKEISNVDHFRLQKQREGQGFFDPSKRTFGEAFAAARKAGLKEFEYGKGNRIAVVLADDPAKAPTSASVDNTTYISNTTLPEVVVTGRARPNSSVRNDTTYLSNTPLSELIVTGTAPVRNDTTYTSNTPLQEVVVTAPRTVKPAKQSWWQQLREANTPERIAERRRVGLGIRSRQRGGILDKRDQLLINPRYGDAQLFGTGKGNTIDLGDGTSVNRYTNMRPFGRFKDITTLSGDLEHGIPGAIRTITGRVDAGGAIQKPDTTITSTRFGEYLKNKPTGFLKKKRRAQFDSEAARFNRADSIAAGRYQQGGALPSEKKSIPEALIADFVVRFLSSQGMGEEQILDPSGQGFSQEAQQMVMPILEQIGEDPQFWQAYQQDPEGTIGQISQSPEQVAMARKGARLEILRKGGKKKKMKSRKCKCGCEITTVKEEGGKLSSKCACGCK